MIYLIELSDQEQISGKKTSVALGIFDGVHRGHKAVIRAAAKNAAENGYAAAVCTFKTATIDTKGENYCPICSDEVKCLLLEKEGAEYIYMPAFSDIRNSTAKSFVEEILKKKLSAKSVVCGRDFRLGKNAVCGTDELAEICKNSGMSLIVVDDISDNGIRICSSDIRRLISEGDIVSANRLLGHDYVIMGEVINGNHFGRQMDFPTANQKLNESLILPKFGVYASYAELDGKIYRGVTNIGVKPTVESGGAPLAETHFPSYSGDLYGKVIAVRLVDFIRPEMRFKSTDILRRQIKADTDKILSMVNFPERIC